MSETNRTSLIPKGSLGLKMLLVCALVLLMSVPLAFVGFIVHERQQLAINVTQELGEKAGGAQIVGGPMLLVPMTRAEYFTDEKGSRQVRRVSDTFVVFAQNGKAEASLSAEPERRRGIYHANPYLADAKFTAEFKPREAVANIDPSFDLDWSKAQIAMFVRDARAVRGSADVSLDGGTALTLEPMNDFVLTLPDSNDGGRYQPPVRVQAISAAAHLSAAPETLSASANLKVGGAQSFGATAFAQNTEVKMTGAQKDASATGYYQSSDAMTFAQDGFSVAWSVPYIARGVDKAGALSSLDLSAASARAMSVSFVGADDVYQGVVRAVGYAILFIGIVFLSTLVFEALSGKRAHPAQYILVGLAQSVFYLLLMSFTEIIGFAPAFLISAGMTIALLAYYAGASSRSIGVGISALIGLSLLYGVMYVLMTIEDFAFFAGSMVAFVVIAGAMIGTSRINWYGRGSPPAQKSENAEAGAPA